MRSFRCRVCDNRLYFENRVCVSCGSSLGYARNERAIVPVDAQGRYVDAAGRTWWRCVNSELASCTWLAPHQGGLCPSCALTRTRPNDADVAGLAAYALAEQAKRHLLYELDALGLPTRGKTGPDGDPLDGLAFDLLSSAGEDVTIGHEDGVITLDLAEGEAQYREKVRVELAEPYRTLLGHFRHEIGHYYEWQLVRGEDLLSRCRALFGDESADYQAAVDRHYSEGPPAGWADSYLSTYATMHPFEDFAETWAHFLHIADTIDTARDSGLVTVGGLEDFTRFRDVVTGVWIPLSGALNQINRSMGQDDLYPFVIGEPVLDKLEFVSEVATGSRVDSGSR